MHNSVVFYRKPHNFSFYPIIHKKVLIFAKRSPPQGGRPFCIVRVSLLYDAFPTAGKDALHRNVPVKYDEIHVVILSTRCRSGAFSAIFRIARKATAPPRTAYSARTMFSATPSWCPQSLSQRIFPCSPCRKIPCRSVCPLQIPSKA